MKIYVSNDIENSSLYSKESKYKFRIESFFPVWWSLRHEMICWERLSQVGVLRSNADIRKNWKKKTPASRPGDLEGRQDMWHCECVLCLPSFCWKFFLSWQVNALITWFYMIRPQFWKVIFRESKNFDVFWESISYC